MSCHNNAGKFGPFRGLRQNLINPSSGFYSVVIANRCTTCGTTLTESSATVEFHLRSLIDILHP